MKNHALLIGVGQRQDDTPAMAVTAADAKRVACELFKRDIVPYDNILTLTDSNATKVKILEGIDSLVTKTKTDKADLVWVYFSGHGYKQTSPEGTDKHFLIAHDTLAADVENTALLGADFIDRINKIKAEKILLLLDCCHAGGISKSRKSRIPFDEKAFLSHANRVVISSSHANKESFTSKPLSVFTYVLINGLAGAYFEENDKDVTVFDLAMYLRETVYPLTKRHQRPQLNVFENTGTKNFILCTYPNGKPQNPVFDSAFRLTDSSGKSIELVPKETDKAYRKKYKWFSSIKGNENIVMQGAKKSTIIININKK
ncbi:caspase family protein [Runella sp. SP2]|uniref:caspase family protein n=1 Tax=Runella sp. SP2 TaxID=2268026 RepID=UPI000F07CB29|nr:caspase family protein [Runella sp. SP2]AYQ31569.1 caspase family protein [Runella sp. SP2]